MNAIPARRESVDPQGYSLLRRQL